MNNGTTSFAPPSGPPGDSQYPSNYIETMSHTCFSDLLHHGYAPIPSSAVVRAKWCFFRRYGSRLIGISRRFNLI